ncbi:MAG: TonB family protein [Balneolales bacterium]|nr:TonB family protein [Balneolales bacterium]
MSVRKKPEKDLRKDYQITLQSSLVLALLLSVGLFKFNFTFGDGFEIEEIVREELAIEDIPQTEIIETPPPPPRPPVPIEVPDDAIIDDDLLDMDAFLDMDAGFDAPPPQPPSDDDDSDEVFVVVENMPEMVGGQEALYAALRYPDMARRAGIEGRVIVQFIVNEQGRVESPQVVRSAGAGGLDEAALAAISQMRFSPGMQRGRPVRVQMTQPVIFRLQ